MELTFQSAGIDDKRAISLPKIDCARHLFRTPKNISGSQNNLSVSERGTPYHAPFTKEKKGILGEVEIRRAFRRRIV